MFIKEQQKRKRLNQAHGTARQDQLIIIFDRKTSSIISWAVFLCINTWLHYLSCSLWVFLCLWKMEIAKEVTRSSITLGQKRCVALMSKLFISSIIQTITHCCFHPLCSLCFLISYPGSHHFFPDVPSSSLLSNSPQSLNPSFPSLLSSPLLLSLLHLRPVSNYFSSSTSSLSLSLQMDGRE